jgi:ribonuclease HI
MNIYTDGSVTNNQTKELRRGGIGVYFADNDSRNVSREIKENPTNQRMELLACIKALEITNNNDNINIYTDSKYTINCVTVWYKNWEINNWKTSKGSEVKNLDLIKKLYNLVNSKNVNFYHVRSHQKEPTDKNKYQHWYGNKMADFLATSSIS